MKAELLYELKSKNFKVYPKVCPKTNSTKYLVYYKGREWGLMTERRIASMAKSWNKPLTKPRLTCKTPRPGCPCCDSPRAQVKELERRANRRANNKNLVDLE